MEIAGTKIERGSKNHISIAIGRLPSNTPIHIDAHIYRGKNDGPTVLLTGGIHGDEINGIEIVRRFLISDDILKLKAGTIIAIPLVNAYGFINFSRDVPDGKDVNRSFPGRKAGSVASRIAHTITNTILDKADIILDFHTGGNARYNIPQIRYTIDDKRAFELAKTFNSGIVLPKRAIGGSLRKTAGNMGITTLTYEGGASTVYSLKSINTALRGIKNILISLGMMEGESPEFNNTVYTKTSWVRARHSGLFYWHIPSGHFVKKGEIIGEINSLRLTSFQVKSPFTGYIIGHNNAAVVNKGDPLFHIGVK